MNNQRAVIVHCWGGQPDYCWYSYVKQALETNGFEVLVPTMPDTDEPNLAKWLPKLQATIGTADANTYLIGHSAGCITIMRYLELLPEEQRVGGVVFVAGFTDDLGFNELKNFFTTPLNFAKIKSKAKSFMAIASDDDPYVPLDRADILKQELEAKVIIRHQAGHFSGAVDGEAACTELPEVVEEIIKMAK